MLQMGKGVLRRVGDMTVYASPFIIRAAGCGAANMRRSTMRKMTMKQRKMADIIGLACGVFVLIVAICLGVWAP